MDDAHEIVAAYWAAAEARDWARFGGLVAEDVVYEARQTRERVRGREAYVRFNSEGFPPLVTVAGSPSSPGAGSPRYRAPAPPFVRRLWTRLWTGQWKQCSARGITAGVLWMTKESWNCSPKPLVPGQAGAVEIHSPLKTGADPGGDFGKRTKHRATGATGGCPVGVVGQAVRGSRAIGRPSAAGLCEAPASHTWRGLAFIVIQPAASRQHRHAAAIPRMAYDALACSPFSPRTT